MKFKKFKFSCADSPNTFFNLQIEESSVGLMKDKSFIQLLGKQLRTLNIVPHSSVNSPNYMPVTILTDETGTVRIRVPPISAELAAGPAEKAVPIIDVTSDLGSPPRKKPYKPPEEFLSTPPSQIEDLSSGMGLLCSPAPTNVGITELPEAFDIDGTGSTAVVMKNIPSIAFNMEFFKIFLGDAIVNSNVSQDRLEIVTQIHEYDAANQSIQIEFTERRFAEEFSALGTLKYLLYDVQIELLHSAACATSGSCVVSLKGIPAAAFNKEFFKIFLGDAIVNSNVSQDRLEIVTQIHEYDTANQCIQVEFTERRFAEEFSALGTIKYLFYDVQIELLNSAACTTYESCIVSFQGIPAAAFNKEFFKIFVCSTIECNELAEKGKGLDVIFKIQDYDDVSGTVKVEFINPVVASAFSVIKPLFYIQYEVKLELLFPDTSLLPTPLGVISSSDACSKFTLSDDIGMDFFIKALLNCRQFYASNNVATGNTQVLTELTTNNVESDLVEVESKRRHLRDKYRRLKREGKLSTWELSTVASVLFEKGKDEVNPEVLRNTKYESLISPRDVATSSAIFTKGAVWTKPATLLLVSTVQANYSGYKDTTKRAEFFRGVSDYLISQGHWYDGPQCEAQMDALQKKFKDYQDIIKKTGSASRAMIPQINQWPYWDCMEEFMRFDVSSNPLVTMSLGSTSSLDSRVDNAERGSSRCQPRGGALIVKPKQKVTPAQQIVNVLAEKNQILKKLLNIEDGNV